MTSPSESLWAPGSEVGPFEEQVRSISIKIGARSLRYSPAFRLCNPFEAERTSFTVPYHGFQYSGLLNNNIDWHIYFHDIYNKLETRFVQQILSLQKERGLSTICYEIGANAGYLTLVMASLADRVIAFEASPQAYQALSARLADNQIEHVDAFDIACSDVDGDLNYEMASGTNMSCRRIVGKSRHRSANALVVSGRHGDGFIEAHALPHPTLLRINAGDDQLHVLEGLSSTIQEAKPVLLLSLAQSITRTPLDQLALRSFLYDDAALFSLTDSEDGLSYKLEAFSRSAPKIVCAPSAQDLLA